MNYKLNEFALVSLGRCGTTMFQNMINSHTKLYLSEECHWMRYLTAPGLEYHRFAEVDDLSINKIPSNSKWWDAIKSLNSSLIIDKKNKKCGLQYIGKSNLNTLETLYKTYPKLPTIILIRDPRALLSSLYRTGIGYPSAANDMKKVIETVKSYTDNILIVRYESFILEPKNCIRRICKFLDVEFEAKMLLSLTEVVSHGSKSALSKQKNELLIDTLPPSQLFPICNQIEDIQALDYKIVEKEIDIISKEALLPHHLTSKDLTIDFKSTRRVNGIFTTKANARCLGIITIDSNIKGIQINTNDQILNPAISFFDHHIFDIRKTETSNITKLKHKNFKNIVSLLEIFESIRKKRIYIYSAGTETNEFIERYNFLNHLNIVAVVDMSPKNKFYIHKSFSKKMIALPQVDDSGKEIYLVTTLKHNKSAKRNLLELGVDEDRIFTVI
ncbi:sulfotransferase [Aliiglaciecola sp. SL4]|uniref:sulfotransferase family protein n=1 Tax=Aliiglaciecola sp. SL4 TaxID=3239806 RepID=UPI00355BE0DD